MNNKAINYFFAEFDYLLKNGNDPKEALLKTAEDYAYVFHDIKSRDNEYKTLVINVKNLNNEIQNFLDKYNKEKEPQVITNKTIKMTTNIEIDDLSKENYENKQNFIVLRYENGLFKININKSNEIFKYISGYENNSKNNPIYVTIYCSKNKAFFYKKGDKYFATSKFEVINMLEREQAPLCAYEKLSLKIDEG